VCEMQPEESDAGWRTQTASMASARKARIRRCTAAPRIRSAVHVYRETKWAVESPGQLRRLRAGVLMAGSPLATSLS